MSADDDLAIVGQCSEEEEGLGQVVEPEGLQALADDVLLRIFQLAAPFNNPENGSRAAQAFIWARTALPRVCKRFHGLLAEPDCPLWRTIHLSISKETAYSSAKRPSTDRSAHTGGGAAHASAWSTSTGTAPLGTSPSGGGGVWGSLAAAQGVVTLGSSPPAGDLALHGCKTFCLVRSERVLQWLSHRSRQCQALYLDFSNINHDFSARSFERLLGLVKGSLSLLVLKDSPSPGRQEGFEAISGMKNLQELCLEGIPQDFLHEVMPYLKLPSLRKLHFKPDLAAYPNPAKLGSLPLSLTHLELANLWVESLPPPRLPTSPAKGSAGAVSIFSQSHTAAHASQPAAPQSQLQVAAFSQCHLSPGMLSGLSSMQGMQALALHACGLAVPPGTMTAVADLGALQLPPGASQLRRLELVGCGLRRLAPHMVSALTGLQALDLRNNVELGQMPDALPAELSLLSQLAFLDLSGCGLTAVPAPVAALPALQRLNLEGNSLSGLPREMASVGSLRWLNISQNRLQQFPPVLLGAARLEELTLSAGPVAGTPVAAFGGLHVQLPRLRLLKVKGATYDCKAVRNLMTLGNNVLRASSPLAIEIVV